MNLSSNMLNLFFGIYIAIVVAVVFLIAITVPLTIGIIRNIKNKKQQNKEKAKKIEEENKKLNEEKAEEEKKEKYFKDITQKLDELEPIDATQSFTFEENDFNIKEAYEPDNVLSSTVENEEKQDIFDNIPSLSFGEYDISSKPNDEIDDEIMQFLDGDESEGDFEKLVSKKSGLFTSKEQESGEVFSNFLNNDNNVQNADLLAKVDIEDELNELYKEELRDLEIQHRKDDEDFDEFHKEIIDRRMKRMQLLSGQDRRRIQTLNDELKNCSKRVQAIVFMDILNKKKF